MDDPRARAARYGIDDSIDPPVRQDTGVDQAAVVETAIQQAIRQGAFDDLPGAGKPIPGLGDHHDPDWWIRRKIQDEQLSGLGPPALMLRVEHAQFADRVDAISREADVRDYVGDFNRRVVEARRQLQGGPPVVTPTHDVEEEVAGWRARREERTPPPADPVSAPRKSRRPRMRRDRS